MTTNPIRGLRILVVEDSVLVADVIAEALETAGATVIGPVGRIDPAMRLARDEALDGALLDVNLSGANSGPVAAALRARGIPFIFLTGYNDTSALPALFRDAPRLLKPFRERELMAEVALRFSAMAN